MASDLINSKDNSTDTEYAGVFDLPNSQGLNPSERILAQLCRRSFLSLWTYPNLHIFLWRWPGFHRFSPVGT